MSLQISSFFLLYLSTSTLLLIGTEAAKVPIGSDWFRINYTITDTRIAFDIVVKTKGWVAIGFGSGVEGSKLVDYFVGNVSNGVVRGQDCWVKSNSMEDHAFQCSETQNWANVRGREVERKSATSDPAWYTEIHVERDLDTKDNSDAVIKYDKKIIFYWATNYYSDDIMQERNAFGYLPHIWRNDGSYTTAPVAISTLILAFAVTLF